MTQKYAKIHIFMIVKLLTVFLLMQSALFAQTNSDENAERLPNTVITIERSALAAGSQFLCLRDSIGHELSLVSAAVGEETVWTRQSTDAPTIKGVIHWQFQLSTRQLIIDLREMGEHFTAGKPLRLTVAPLQTRWKEYHISVYETASLPDARQRVETPKVSVNIELN